MAEKTPTQQLAEKLLYTLSAGWFYGETPCVLHDSTGLFSKNGKAFGAVPDPHAEL